MTDWPQAYARTVLAEVDSTLDEARRCASTLAGPAWILALNQTAARGRRGRAWVHPKGNFAATLLLPADMGPGAMALRSFVAALALFDAVHAVTGRSDGLALKWPNDVLLNGGKLAGILLESIAQGSNASHLAIGIGVNLAQAPGAEAVEATATRPVSLVSETGALATPEDFLSPLAASFAEWDQRFVTYGFDPIRQAWLQRAARLGEVITARTSREEVIGTFRDVDIEGQLVLQTAEGRRSIPAADIYF